MCIRHRNRPLRESEAAHDQNACKADDENGRTHLDVGQRIAERALSKRVEINRKIAVEAIAHGDGNARDIRKGNPQNRFERSAAKENGTDDRKRLRSCGNS